MAGQVGHEHDRTLEHAHEERRSTGVVAGDLGAQLGETAVEIILGDHDVTEHRIVVGSGERCGCFGRVGHVDRT